MIYKGKSTISNRNNNFVIVKKVKMLQITIWNIKNSEDIL